MSTGVTFRRSNLEQSKRRIGRRCFPTGLVVHGPQIHLEGANQRASYQLVVADLRGDGAVSPAAQISLRAQICEMGP